MNLLFRVLGYLKQFKLLLVLSIFLNTLFSILSTVTIIVIQPVLQALFEPNTMQKMQVPAEDISFQLKEWFFRTVMNVVTGSTHSETLFRLGLLIIGLFTLKNLAKYLGNNVNTRLGEGVIKSIRDQLFTRIMAQSMDFFNKSKVGDSISLMLNSVGLMNGAITPLFFTLFRQPIEIALFLGVLLTYSPYLTFIAFSTSIGSLILVKLTTAPIKKYALRMQDAMAQLTQVLQEFLIGIRTVKSTSSEDKASSSFHTETRTYVRAAIKNQKIVDLVPAINEMLAIISLCAVLFIGGNEVYSGNMKAHELMTFLFALFSIMSPIAQITSTPATIQKGLVAAQSIFSIIDKSPSVKDGDHRCTSFNTALSIQDLSFSYDGQHPVLQNVSFDIAKGKKIALVGSSGSGKSTMSDLVIRLYDPTSGSILLDSQPIHDFTLESYRSLFGIVSQEAFLFHDTIAANIAFGSDATREQIIEAAKIAHAHTFINALPEGYDTIIGDRGVLLSGGQRQRLAIARALARRPEILIFDEATSALDAESERLVQEAIADVLKNRTALIIAHRLSTILDADCIHVFDHGRIIESGTHQELVALGGIYASMCALQSLEA
ncbi:MAG: ABC transporter ATP-binding protein [Ignavibacteria bacterium]|nr:ABC transporter ATP-binding protein [Ignavibacteria bacterium]